MFAQTAIHHQHTLRPMQNENIRAASAQQRIVVRQLYRSNLRAARLTVAFPSQAQCQRPGCERLNEVTTILREHGGQSTLDTVHIQADVSVLDGEIRMSSTHESLDASDELVSFQWVFLHDRSRELRQVLF